MTLELLMAGIVASIGFGQSLHDAKCYVEMPRCNRLVWNPRTDGNCYREDMPKPVWNGNGMDWEGLE